MLDSRLNDFFTECKKKTDAITKEINNLQVENIDLLRSVKEHEEQDLKLRTNCNKLQLQYEQMKEINNKISDDKVLTNERLTKAKNDYCDITKAYQLQKANITKNEEEIRGQIEKSDFDNLERIKNYKRDMKQMDEKIEFLKKEIHRKESINSALRLELLDRELKDTHRMTNIMDENRKFSKLS